MEPTAESVIDLAALRKAGDQGWVAPKLHAAVVAAQEGLRVHHVVCGCRQSGYEPREVTPSPLFVFVERGSFRRRSPAGDLLADGGFAYFASPGGEEEYAHPHDGGDVCMSVTMTPALLAAVTGGDLALPERPVGVDAADYRLLRWIAADIRRGDEAWVEDLIELVGRLIRERGTVSVALRRPTTIASHRRLVDGVREALLADPSLGVTDLAGLVGCSPFHVSRVFRRQTGTTISAYRRRLRVRAAVVRVADGEENLARLAFELGFSDHSHLTRSLVGEFGATPTAIREQSRAARRA
jgi:AraC-like DNA-binding protein